MARRGEEDIPTPAAAAGLSKDIIGGGKSKQPKFKLKEKLDKLRTLRKRAENGWNANIKSKIFNSFVFVFSPVCFLMFVVGSYDFFRNVEENKCQMTYMFEYPQYVEVPMDTAVAYEYPMYGLYVYAEGKFIEPARNLKFTGIPVLYLHGNAGSYKQMRSFASVALRKWLDNRTPFHFDFFSIDFNEEISGMYGYVLDRQNQYAKHVVQKITSLYEDYHHIVIIGHSMGGIVAKSLNTEQTTVQMIYTMATPHLHPPIITDPELDLFYYFVTRNWTQISGREPHNSIYDEASPVTLVSIAGGDRDFLVSGKLTRWTHNSIHTSTPSIPTVWASTDHLCIVWCKQLVMVVVRSMFDLVEYKQKQKYYAITENSTARIAVLDYHFRKRTSGKSFHSLHPTEVSAEKPPKAKWNEILTHSYCQASFDAPTYIMIPQLSLQEKVNRQQSKHYEILVATSNTKARNWIFGCKNQGSELNIRYCTSLENFSNQTVLLPSFHRNRKIIHLGYDAVSKFSHLVVKMNPVNFKTCLDIDVYNREDRTGYLGEVIKDSDNAMFYNFSYPVSFNQSKLFAWKVHARILKDKNKKELKCPGHHNSVGIFRHGNFQTHNFFKNESLHIKFTDTSATSGHILLYLDKGCKYSVRVDLDHVGTAGQLFRIFVKLIPSYFASIILMSLFFQKSKDWINFHRILLSNAYYLCIVPGFIVSFSMVFLPTDYRYLLTEAEYSALLPIICYFIAYAMVLIISLGLWVLTLTFGNGIHAIVTKFIGKKLGNVPDKVTDLALTLTMEKFPLSMAVLVIAVGMSTSGALGLALGMILHVLKIFKGYEGILEDLIRGRVQTVGEALSPINFHMHCALLWFVAAAVNVPSLVYWIHSFRYGVNPNWDMSLYICLMLTPTIAVLWQGFTPNFNPTMWSIQRYLCYIMGIILVIYGSHRIYFISMIVALVLISLAICQLISKFAEEPVNGSETQRASLANDHPFPPSPPKPTSTKQKSESKKGSPKEDLKDSMSVSSDESSISDSDKEEN